MILDAKKERDFQKKHIERQKEKYLKTDVIQKYKYDYGYSMKIKLLESFLEDKNENRFILDVANAINGELGLHNLRMFNGNTGGGLGNFSFRF